MKNLLTLLIIGNLFFSCTNTPKEILPVPSTKPGKAQLKQIERKYGMFIHFGINTFHDMEWTDGSLPAHRISLRQLTLNSGLKQPRTQG